LQICDSEFLSYPPSLINRAIVDHDDFAVDTLARYQSFETAWKISAAVVYGHNDRQERLVRLLRTSVQFSPRRRGRDSRWAGKYHRASQIPSGPTSMLAEPSELRQESHVACKTLHIRREKLRSGIRRVSPYKANKGGPIRRE
jgi:hypothetical protein